MIEICSPYKYLIIGVLSHTPTSKMSRRVRCVVTENAGGSQRASQNESRTRSHEQSRYLSTVYCRSFGRKNSTSNSEATAVSTTTKFLYTKSQVYTLPYYKFLDLKVEF